MVFGGNKQKREVATFAGGCFWCTEASFEHLDGVLEVISGYTGGHVENPTYEQVCSGTTGHLEAIQVIYDPEKISYEELVEFFWRQIDPTDAGGSFVDRGEQYTSAIFYHNEEQKEIAERSKSKLASSGKFDKPIVTKIRPAEKFYPAEDYHQDFYKKNPVHYKRYRRGSGRDDFIKRVWRDTNMKEMKKEENSEKNKETSYRQLSPEELKKVLTPLQYHVTQEEGTEPPF
ncbi:MAG: peptide-methionine (S)-S-oxide reductase, partial [Calditrichaeota bacterium]